MHLFQIVLYSELSNSSCRKLVKCTEILQSIVEPRYISNISLGEGLLLMQFCHSRNALDFLSRIVPTGSTSTLRRTIEAIGSEKQLLPANDIIIGMLILVTHI